MSERWEFIDTLDWEDPRSQLHRDRRWDKEPDYASPHYKGFVNMYEAIQCYGGPEEGGWFYEEGIFLRCYGYYSNKVAEEIKKLILAKLEHKPTYRMGHGAHDGVDPEGFGDNHYLIPGGAWGNDKIVIRVEDYKGYDYPQRQPRYC
jgi:hypothetical protein|tara:strand:+ start:292 stop:732 length:441 start_codon:yes stop_codon:yes gene_type:complete